MAMEQRHDAIISKLSQRGEHSILSKSSPGMDMVSAQSASHYGLNGYMGIHGPRDGTEFSGSWCHRGGH
jgi:hypothetical protein